MACNAGGYLIYIDAEVEDYVGFATETGVGEAQALAIAKYRNYVLLTNDNPATKFAQQSNLGSALSQQQMPYSVDHNFPVTTRAALQSSFRTSSI